MKKVILFFLVLSILSCNKKDESVSQGIGDWELGKMSDAYRKFSENVLICKRLFAKSSNMIPIVMEAPKELIKSWVALLMYTSSSSESHSMMPVSLLSKASIRMSVVSFA